VSGLEPSARALLEAVRETHDPTDEDRAATRELLEQRLGAAAFVLPAAATSTIPAGAAKVVGKATAKAVTASVAKGTLTGMLPAKLVVLTLGSVITAGVTWGVFQAREPRSVTPTPAAITTSLVSSPSHPSIPALNPEPSSQIEHLPVVAHETPAPGATASTARHLSTGRPSSLTVAASEENTLGDEARLLSQVFNAMQSGAPDRALLLLDEHAARYPYGTMRAAASTERVVALCSLGRVDEARSEGARFLQTFPTDPLVVRVRSSCAFAR
jgi:hypothetical protein